MSGARARPGRTLSLRPPEGAPWFWMTNTMAASITFRALGIHARRILDFLMCEHASHAGRQNGNLAAPYQQLETWGVTTADVRKGLAELYATGFVRLTKQGLRQAGGGEPSRYALTWLPTMASTTAEEPPSHDWTRVIDRLLKQGVGNVPQARRWLKQEIAGEVRGQRKKQRSTPHLQVVSPIACEARRAS
jgi:hypothetical protein